MSKPPPRHGDKIAIDGDYQHQAYYNGPIPQRFWHYNKLHQAINYLRPDDHNILDAGCGSGLLPRLIHQRPHTTITAIDSNPSAIKFAKNQYPHPNIRFILERLDNTDLPDNHFDAIFLLEVIEHITTPQAQKLMKKFHQTLKPNGQLIITTPNRHSAWPLIEWLLDHSFLTPTLAEEQHEHIYTKAELIKIAQEAGFATKKIKTINNISPWLAILSWPLALKVSHKENFPYGNIFLATFQKTSTN